MPDRFHGARLKLKRAQAYLDEIEEGIQTFSGSAFQSVTLEDDPETGEHFFVLHELRRPDPELSLPIGDFLNNLRSALDHLVFQLVKHPVVTVNGPRTDDRHIAFPICDDPDKFDKAKWKLRGAAPGVEASIEELQPYPGRRSPFTLNPSRLSLLRDLNDWDKHRLLHVIENELSTIGFLNPEKVESSSTRDPGRLEAPAEIARYKLRPGLHPEVDVGFYLSTNVTFEGGPANGRGVTITLTGMRYEVGQILARLTPYVAP